MFKNCWSAKTAGPDEPCLRFTENVVPGHTAACAEPAIAILSAIATIAATPSVSAVIRVEL